MNRRLSRLDLVSNRRWFFLVSAVVVGASLVLLAIPPALRPGIEFTSGTTTLLRFDEPVDQADIRGAYAELGHEEARIQSTGAREFLIRTRELDIPEGAFTEVAPEPEFAPVGPTLVEPLGAVLLGAEEAEGEVQLHRLADGDPCTFADDATTAPAGEQWQVIERHEQCEGGAVYRVTLGAADGYIRVVDTHGFEAVPESVVEVIEQGERTVIETALEAQFGPFQVLEFAQVSPVVSKVAVRNAAVAVAVSAIFIMGYVAFAFSALPRPMRYATCAIIALVHDVVIVLGAFSLFGKLFDIEVNLMFITGLLTVIGFSVHDSIVVFDRIREHVLRAPNVSLAENVNAALVQTLTRSLNTSLTLLLTVITLLLLGGVTIRAFLLVILVGVIAGTYSSIGIAAQVLVAWDEGDLGRWFRRLRGRRDEEPATV